MAKIKVVYSNYDALDVTFQGRLPKATCDILLAAKEAAQEARGQLYIEVGPGRLKCHLFPSSPQGTKFHLDTGPDGEKWFIAAGQDMKQWNIRCSVRSEALRDHGYERVRDRLYERLEAMGAQVIGEAIARVDFCIDLLTGPEFCPDPNLFVCHYNTKVQSWEDEPGQDKFFDVFYYNHRPNSVRVGSIKYRQVAIYNKRREILHKSRDKKYWFEVWGVDPKDRDQQVWRIELRAGKDYLREFGIKTFEDLEAAIGDVFLHAMNAVRYRAEDQTDTNVTRQRLHEIWQLARDQVANSMAINRSGVIPSRVKNVYRDAMVEMLGGMLCGVSATYAYVSGQYDPAKIVGLIEKTLLKFDKRNPGALGEKIDAAAGRYYFLDARLKH